MLVMSCNVAGGLDDRWPSSREVLQKIAPDLIGFQELYPDQKDFYLAGMPEYRAFCTIDLSSGGMPANGIFYRAERFEVLSAGAHWLSETPHICGSKSWGSRCVRLVNWMIMKDKKEGVVFKYYNTHLDHVSQEAREKQAAMINAAAEVHEENMPQVLTGDMNAAASNKAIALFKKALWRDTYTEAHDDDYDGISWHALEGDDCTRQQDVPGNEKGEGRIDWIFVRGGFQCTGAAVRKDTDAAGVLPSDHYFVSAEIDFV